MNFLKKIMGDKAQTSGLLMMLKGFGFDIDSLIPKAEEALLKWFSDMEAKAGARLTAVAIREDNKFLISLYTIETDSTLKPYGETFVLSDFKKFLNNLESQENATIENSTIAASESDNGNATSTGAEPNTNANTADTSSAGE